VCMVANGEQPLVTKATERVTLRAKTHLISSNHDSHFDLNIHTKYRRTKKLSPYETGKESWRYLFDSAREINPIVVKHTVLHRINKMPQCVRSFWR
jgi:hypothetical protein